MNNLTILWLLTENITANAENSAGDIDFGSALVSFLYFLGALLLIYFVLILVNKLGKKKQEQNKDSTEPDEKVLIEQTDNKGDNNG